MKSTFVPVPAALAADLGSDTPSPAVSTVTRFVVDGAEFPTFEAAIEHRENQIEAKIRHLFRDSSPFDQMAAVQWVLDNRAELRRLLDY